MVRGAPLLAIVVGLVACAPSPGATEGAFQQSASPPPARTLVAAVRIEPSTFASVPFVSELHGPRLVASESNMSWNIQDWELQ